MLTQEEFEKVVVRLKGDEVDVEAQARNEDEITQETAEVPGPAAIPAPVQLCQLLSELWGLRSRFSDAAACLSIAGDDSGPRGGSRLPRHYRNLGMAILSILYSCIYVNIFWSMAF